jgi:WD40 repeat protein
LTGQRPRLISSSSSEVRVWDFDNLKKKHLLQMNVSHVTSMLSTQGTLWTGTYDGQLITWDLERGSRKSSLQISNGAISSIAMMTDGKLVVGTWDNVGAVVSRSADLVCLFIIIFI